mgnify:CR=1 FL=1
MISPEDRSAIEAQLGRGIRGALAVAHRCACGQPDVVLTAPRLEDGTPFPTTYYLTCPRATGAVGTLEADGVMRELQDELDSDPELAAQYLAAHELYLATREELGHVAEIAGISAGGMPTRVKCLHVLVAHSLAVGPGVNPIGDKALEMLGDWSAGGTCVTGEPCE